MSYAIQKGGIMDKGTTLFACFMTAIFTFVMTMAVKTSGDAEYQRIHDRIDNMYKEFFDLMKEKK